MQPDVNYHRGGQILQTGTPLEQAKAVMILIHGRGATADSILSLAAEFDQPEMAFLAPHARGNTWYPYPFIMPITQNEPFLSSALAAIGDLVDHVVEAEVSADKIVLLGFSQGACLALEYAIRNARRYGGVIGFSGGLIGEPGTAWDYPGTFDGTPIFLGCDERDSHIPAQRVHESADVLGKHGANVTKRLYAGMGHTINDDELNHARVIVSGVLA